MSSRFHPRRAVVRFIARLTHRLARSSQARGDHERAERLLRRAIELADGTLGDSEFAAVLNDLGVLYKALGRFDEAERVYQRAVELVVASRGGDSAGSSTRVAATRSASRPRGERWRFVSGSSGRIIRR